MEGRPAAAAPQSSTPQGGGPEQSHRASPSFGRQLLERALALREGSIIVVTLITAIYFAVNTSTFLTTASLKTLLPYFAPFAIIAAGEVFVMILGEIDLSIGAMYLFAPFVFYKLTTAGIPLVPSVVLALLVCMAVGLANGFFVAVVGINSFVATLAMLFTFEGLALIISHGTPVTTPGTPGAEAGSGGHLSTFAEIFGGGTYAELIWALADRGDPAGRADVHPLGPVHGGDRLQQARRRRGRRARALVTIRNFILCSLTAGMVGIFEAVRSGTVQPDPAGANEILFLAVAAGVIGGTLLTGGSGTVVGALIGALFLGILKEGLVLQGVNANYLLFYTGLAIIVAMTVNVNVQRVRKGRGGG